MDQLINAISLGSIYALVALGYTMVYGIIRLINFAHGDVIMLGAFISAFFLQTMQFDFLTTIVLTVLTTAFIGVLIERIAYKPLRKSTRIAALITAIGVSYFIQNVMILLFGAQSQAYDDPFEIGQIQLFGEAVSLKKIVIFAITVLLMLVLTFIVQKTKMGKAMRAVSTDEDAAQLMGINVDNVISFTFFLGSALAGVAGMMIATYYGSIDPLLGVQPGLKAFIAAVLGGIGSIPGAMLGGYVIGALETIANVLGLSLVKDAIVYIILIVILLINPAGLLGKKTKEKV